MNTYTVTQVNDNVRDWQTKAGAPWKSYRVTLRNNDGRELPNVELSRAASAPKPEVGQALEGTVDQSGQYGPKFAEVRKGGPGGGFRGKTAEERRSIAMQASHNAAVQIASLALQHGKESAVVAQAVEAAADRLYQRVMKAEAGS